MMRKLKPWLREASKTKRLKAIWWRIHRSRRPPYLVLSATNWWRIYYRDTGQSKFRKLYHITIGRYASLVFYTTCFLTFSVLLCFTSWISSFHEHETLLQENEDERLTKEEKDMAWEVYRRALEWEEVQRVPLSESSVLPKPSPSIQTEPLPLPKGFNRSRFVNRNCTRIAHQLTLISQGIKLGSSTFCGECGIVLTWADFRPASKTSEVN